MITDEDINRYKRVLIVHSYIYYTLNSSVVADSTWQTWADWLAKHNRPTGFYDDVFKDWDGTTGYHLPKDDWVKDRAIKVLRSSYEKDNY